VNQRENLLRVLQFSASYREILCHSPYYTTYHAMTQPLQQNTLIPIFSGKIIPTIQKPL
jgi:hypothetical protein